MPLPLVPLGIGLGTSLLGSLLGKKKPQTTTTTGTSTTTPSFDPAVSPLLGPLVQAGLSRLRNRGGLPAGFESQGLGAINQTFDTIGQGLTNKLVGSGQIAAGGNNAAQAVLRGNLEGARGGEIANFLTNLPNVARDFENQDMAQAMAILGLGRGSTTTSTGTSTQPGQTTGEALGAGFNDFGSILGFLASQGAFNGSKPKVVAGGIDILPPGKQRPDLYGRPR